MLLTDIENTMKNRLEESVLTLNEMKGLACTFPICNEQYQPPTYDEINSLISGLGLSQRQVALITGARYNEKGSTIVRRWKAHPDNPDHRVMPYSAWRLLVEFAGLSDTDSTKQEFEKKTRRKQQ